MKTMFVLLAASALALYSARADITYTGADGGDWSTATNWSDGNQPNLSSANTYTVNGNSVLYSGVQGDWQDNTIVNLLGGATWTQTTNNWIKVGNTGLSGTLNITNGEFNTGSIGLNFYDGNGGTGTVNIGTSGTLAGNATVNVQGASTFTNNGQVNVTGGIISLANTSQMTNNSSGSINAGSYGMTVADSSVFDNYGALTLGADFRIHGAGTVNIQGGPVSLTIISFDDTTSTGVFNLEGGDVSISTDEFDGIFESAGSQSYVNFTPGSTAELDFLNIGNADADITDGLICYNGTTVPDDGSVFTVTHPNADETVISLAAVVPEPRTIFSILFGAATLLMIRARKLRV